MNQHLRYIIIFTIPIILYNQFIHLSHLYQEEKTQYIYQYNTLLNGALYEFDMKSTNLEEDNIVSYNASENKIVYYIKQKVISFQLNEKDNVQQITERKCYDIRSPQKWTLKNFYPFLQTKLDSIQSDIFSPQFIILDSTGQIKDTYPDTLSTFPDSPEYYRPLGFISGDTLMATYHYPLTVFIQATSWQLVLTFLISLLFVISLLNHCQMIRDEKKSGEYRELFIHNLVHDLKRPIENQIKTCYLLLHSPAGELTPFLERNREQLNEMLQSINYMLLQSTDAHGLRLNVKEFNLKETLEALKQKERWNTNTNKQFDIQVDFRSDNPLITGDHHFLFAVFQNFIENALKYSGDRVNIQITCMDIDAQQVQIRIGDNGFGISSQNLKHVFERFNRGDYQGNKKIKGHGLGLHYAHTVIRAHGGKISIQSEEGKGTTLFIVLPRKAKIKNKYKQ